MLLFHFELRNTWICHSEAELKFGAAICSQSLLLLDKSGACEESLKIKQNTRFFGRRLPQNDAKNIIS